MNQALTFNERKTYPFYYLSLPGQSNNLMENLFKVFQKCSRDCFYPGLREENSQASQSNLRIMNRNFFHSHPINIFVKTFVYWETSVLWLIVSD